MNTKCFYSFSSLVLLFSLIIPSHYYSAKAGEVTSVTTAQPEDPEVVKENQELEVLTGKSQESGYTLMRKSCNNVTKEGKIVKIKSNSSKLCQSLYKSQVNALKRASFCKTGVNNLPPEIDAIEAKEIAAMIKKRCDDAINEPSQ